MTVLLCWQGRLEGKWKERVQNLMRSWVCPELRVRWLSAGQFSLEGCPLVKCTCVCWVPELSLGHLRYRLVQLHLTKKSVKLLQRRYSPPIWVSSFFPIVVKILVFLPSLIFMGMIFLREYWWEEGECVKKWFNLSDCYVKSGWPHTSLPNAAVECSWSLGKRQNQLFTLSWCSWESKERKCKGTICRIFPFCEHLWCPCPLGWCALPSV